MQQESDIVKAQQESSKNVMTMEEISRGGQGLSARCSGRRHHPYAIMLYPATFEQKDQVINTWTTGMRGKAQTTPLSTPDMVETISSMTGDIMDGITVVLVAFAAISWWSA